MGFAQLDQTEYTFSFANLFTKYKSLERWRNTSAFGAVRANPQGYRIKHKNAVGI